MTVVGELVILGIRGGMMNSVIGEGENNGWYETGMMNSVIMNEFCCRRETDH
jgi:hypothetical protein